MRQLIRRSALLGTRFIQNEQFNLPAVSNISSIGSRQYTTQIEQGNNVITAQFNHVGRDKHQDEDANAGTAYKNPWYEYLVSVWNGLDNPGDIEIGGQEYGAAIEKARISPADNLRNIAINSPRVRKRSLGRGAYANAVYALHPNDAKECYEYVKRYGANAFIKLFDYNVNWDEMENVINIISNIFETFELALPHSPDSNKEFQTLKSTEIADRLGKILEDPNNLVSNVEASIKRMVKGMTEDEAIEAVDIMAPQLLKRGINKITLHAHGESAAAACAAFIYRCAEYGINVGVDVVPEPISGEASFPTINKITNILLDKYGIDARPKGSDKDRLNEVAKIQTIIDESLAAVKVQMADYWTEYDMMHMGMPSGGARYLFDDIMKSSIFLLLNLDPKNPDHVKQACKIVQYTYRKTRDDFGFVNSVTPGHKRVGDIAIKLTCNIAAEINQYAISLDKKVSDLNEADIKIFYTNRLQELTKHQLYHDISAEVLDAFRNGVGDRQLYPANFSDSMKDFLCREHMQNSLQKSKFKMLPESIKNDLINNSLSKTKVNKLLSDFFDTQEGKLFLAKSHMNERLEQMPFKELDSSIINTLRNNPENQLLGKGLIEQRIEFLESNLDTTSSQQDQELKKHKIDQLYEISRKLHILYDATSTKDKILSQNREDFDPLSLVDTAGAREYTEQSKAKELGPEMEEELIALGYSGENLQKKKVEGILSKTFFHYNLDKSSAPSPHGLSRDNFQNELKIDNMDLNSKLLYRISALGVDGAISATNPEGFEADPKSLDFKYDLNGKHAEKCAKFIEEQSWKELIAGSTSKVLIR
ncbi:MAG: hypothetical protein HOM96_01170 [Rickettsiales bacterium]|jgi:hypothetical protein|nr:hypothetical protein [Rickettsiales bacterium]